MLVMFQADQQPSGLVTSLSFGHKNERRKRKKEEKEKKGVFFHISFL